MPSHSNRRSAGSPAGERGATRAIACPGVLWPLGLAAASVLLSGCSPTPKPHNLLLIGIDTLRADHLSSYGYPRQTSPVLDAWAQGGTLYQRAYAPASWTLPSMAMLMTGRLRSDNSGDLGPREASLAERMHEAGYSTAAVVSNPLLSEQKGFARGFDDYQLVPAAPGQRTNGWPAGEVVRRALDQRARVLNHAPWFQFLFFFDPHDPYAPAGGSVFVPFDDQERRAAFRQALPESERALLGDAEYQGIEQRIALYDSEIRQVDQALGQLFEQLSKSGSEANTLVALTADHGEGLWQRARLTGEADKPQAFFPALYFDHGVMLYEEQIHVPLILRGPGVPAGVRRSEPVWSLDLMATFEQRLGLLPLEPLIGRDLLDFEGLSAPRDLVAFTSRGASLLVEGRYKLHEPRDYRVEQFGAQREFYDLGSDPLELSDRYALEPRDGLIARLAVWRKAGLREGGRSSIDQGLLDALGYLPDMVESAGSSQPPEEPPR